MHNQNDGLGIALLAAAALFEYIFPPFPGDTITALGGALVTGFGWNLGLVFFAVCVGALAGSFIDYGIGVWIAKKKPPKPDGKIQKLVARFHRHGAAYLIVSRFLPGVRALFFVAAGMANMKPAPVLLWSGLSAVLWNALLISIGLSIGNNLDTIGQFVTTYSIFVWVVIGCVVIGWGVKKLFFTTTKHL